MCAAQPFFCRRAYFGQRRRGAVSRRCRHQLADLSEGSIDADGCLVCPWHGSAFDLEDGQPRRGPAANPQDKLEIRMQAGRVMARLPGRDR